MRFFLFPFYPPLDSMNCRSTYLRMVAKYYGKAFTIIFLKKNVVSISKGVSLKGTSEAAWNAKLVVILLGKYVQIRLFFNTGGAGKLFPGTN